MASLPKPWKLSSALVIGTALGAGGGALAIIAGMRFDRGIAYALGGIVGGCLWAMAIVGLRNKMIFGRAFPPTVK